MVSSSQRGPAVVLDGGAPGDCAGQPLPALHAMYALKARHVAIIMDGNGRWAQQRGLPRIEGHRRGARAVRDTVRAARKQGLSALTLYAFSEQNWGRPLDEVSGLMQLLYDYVIEERSEILENGIRLQAIGNTARLPAFVRMPLEQLSVDSAQNDKMVLSLALSYGGRESIVEATRKVLQAVAAGRQDPAAIDEEVLFAAMQTASLPPVDLIIRTSGERRVSNFMLWEGVHAVFYATDRLWPDFSAHDLILALCETGLAMPRPAPPAASFSP